MQKLTKVKNISCKICWHLFEINVPFILPSIYRARGQKTGQYRAPGKYRAVWQQGVYEKKFKFSGYSEITWRAAKFPRRAHNTVMKNWLFIVSYYFFIAADRNVILNTLRRMASLVRFKYVTEHTSLVRFK